MLSDLELWGVDKVDGAAVTIAGQVVCTDSGRWPVQREFNRRMKRRFQELGIRIFNPVQTITLSTSVPALLEKTTAMNTQQPLAKQLRADGYRFVRAAEMRGLLEQVGALTDWPEFAATWNDLGPDTYMADGGRYRKRRHAVFAVTARGIVRQPAQPHFQSRDYNTLNGGIERWFEPVTERAASSASLATVLIFCRKLFGMLSPSRTWHVEVHQFRIEARRGRLAVRPPRVRTATGWTTCWCCW